MIAAIALAALLPSAPHPSAPFPRIITDAATLTDVAPGIAYGDYQMMTADGPLSVHVISIDLSEPTVRLGAVLAHDRLVSEGEPVSSMAHRTGAVAGVNGDYFDINQTNQPLNILIENGKLVRMPMQRWAVSIDARKSPHFSEFSIAPTALIGTQTVPLRTINDWPPGGRVVLMTPDFGSLRPVPDVTELRLEPTSGTPPFATYRVTGVADNTQTEPPGYYLAVGPLAYGTFALPETGDALTILSNADAVLADLQTAIGGGPLLVQNGRWYSDPDGPSNGEFATHMPATGVATTADGRMLLFEIDGRQPALSIGLLQPQIAALMIAFGATTGMQFDGGGSSTIVARIPGDPAASVRNSPSDGTERRVADGLFVYSDAPIGPPARLVAWPQSVRAFPGARVSLRFAAVDRADHPAGTAGPTRTSVVPAALGAFDGTTFVAGDKTRSGMLRVRSGALRLDVPIEVTTHVARVEILPRDPVVPEAGGIKLSVRAFDRNGYPIALPESLPWRARNAKIDSSGNLRAGARNATVTLQLGSYSAVQPIVVGEHGEGIAFAPAATFATAPRGGAGELRVDSACETCVMLRYDFTGTERAAYANVSLRLPQRALGVSLDVFGDGNGETLRLAVNNAINERFMYTLARVDWHGWRRVEFRFPPELPQPLTLKALYVINRVGPEAPVTAAGSVGFRDVRTIVAGSLNNAPK